MKIQIEDKFILEVSAQFLLTSSLVATQILKVITSI